MHSCRASQKIKPLSEAKLPLSAHYIEHAPKHINQEISAECTNDLVSIPIVVQWREDSKIIEAIAENDFRFQRLLGMVCTTEVKQDHLYILRQFLQFYKILATYPQCNKLRTSILNPGMLY